MKAVVIETFGQRPSLMNVPDPSPAAHGVVIEVKATGVCRSDWHGWMGHDDGVALPHVPGHELAGVVAAVGEDVRNWRVGDRVTVPFIAACGSCPQCHGGHQQVCDAQFQPGFTHWGSFAEYVGIHHADLNLVSLPETLDFSTAASLGCRFATSFRAVVDQGRVSAGDWVAIHGCGGVGLSAVMIAHALGANVIAVDISDAALGLAQSLGARATINAGHCADVPGAVKDISGGGAHVSIDALGHPAICAQSVLSLRKRGRHVQVGLLLGDQSTPAIPMSLVIANELEIVGSHGMQAHRYGAMLGMIESGLLQPSKLVGREITLAQSIDALINMDKFQSPGATVVTEF